jgi:hypothetical protein
VRNWVLKKGEEIENHVVAAAAALAAAGVITSHLKLGEFRRRRYSFPKLE